MPDAPHHSTSPPREPQRYLALELLNGLPRQASREPATSSGGGGREGRAAWLNPDALIRWLSGAGDRSLSGAGDRWLSATGDPAVSLPSRRILLREIWDLASAIDRALLAFSAGKELPEDAVFTLNRALAAGSRTTCLVVEGPRVGLHERPWRWCGPTTGDGPDGLTSVLALLAPVALDCARLVATVDPSRLRICAAEDCGSWFLDASKGGQRRWCSMRACGNRAKAARHRRRRASG